MFKQERLIRVKWPTFVMVISIIALGVMVEPPFNLMSFVYIAGSYLVTSIITAVFAYMTCVFFVFRKNRSQRAVWINYIVWMLIMCNSNIAALIG